MALDEGHKFSAKACRGKADGLAKIQSVLQCNASLAGLMAVLEPFLNIMATVLAETTSVPAISTLDKVKYLEGALPEIYL